MGTTIAGNQHIGSNTLKEHFVPLGRGGIFVNCELYEQDRIFVYQFNPTYDQRDDGVLAIEFYYYYRRPTTDAFWNYFYNAQDYYIYPFLAWYDEDGEDGGKWGGIITDDSAKISLVGRETGWIHVTLHVEEYIWGRYTQNGKTYNNSIYIGIYSPILVLNWGTSSANATGGVVPYEIFWNFDDFEDDTVYDLLIGGYLEDCYVSRRQLNEYPSFYITYRDVTPENFNYTVNETAVMNVASGGVRKSVYKKLLADVKAACGTADRKMLANRNPAGATVTASDNHFFQTIFKRMFSDNQNVTSKSFRKHGLRKSVSSIISGVSDNQNGMLFFRGSETEVQLSDSSSKKISYIRKLIPDPNVESEVVRRQVLFRSAMSESDFTARPFASRLFFRTVQTVVGFWDWLRGKIREANNMLTFFCPINLEITFECKI